MSSRVWHSHSSEQKAAEVEGFIRDAFCLERSVLVDVDLDEAFKVFVLVDEKVPRCDELVGHAHVCEG